MPKESAMPHASLGHLVQAAVGWAVLAGWAWFGQAEPAQAAGPPEPLLAVALFPSVVGGTGQTGGLSGRAAGSSSEPPAAGATAQAVGPPSRTVRVWGEVGVGSCLRPHRGRGRRCLPALPRWGEAYWVPACAGITLWPPHPAVPSAPPASPAVGRGVLDCRLRRNDTGAAHRGAWIPAFAEMTQGGGKDTSACFIRLKWTSFSDSLSPRNPIG
jgi:hypothetical protein